MFSRMLLRYYHSAGFISAAVIKTAGEKATQGRRLGSQFQVAVYYLGAVKGGTGGS